MKRYLLYILSWAVVCMLFYACSEKEEPQAENKHIVKLDMSITTRATGGNTTEDVPQELKIWVYGTDESGNTGLLLYKLYDQVIWKKLNPIGQNQPEFTTYIPEQVEVDKLYTSLRAYAVINSGQTSITGFPNDLAEVTEELLKGNTLTFANTTDINSLDNRILMYGTGKNENLSLNNFNQIDIEAERCMAKLELYFTQRHPGVNLIIKEVNLSRIPDKGYLAPQTVLPTTEISATETPLNLYTGVLELTDNQVLDGSTQIGGDSDAFAKEYDKTPEKFAHIAMSKPFLLERNSDGNELRILENDASVSSANAYVLQIKYSQIENNSTVDKTVNFALPKVERNTRYRIFIRVKEDVPIEVYTDITEWKYGVGNVPVVDITDENGN